MPRHRRVWPLVVAALHGSAGALAGQSVTGAAIQGRLTGPGGSPVAGAVVQVADPANGARWQVETGSQGRYFLDNLPVGGPYRLTARAIGYAPAVREGIVLRLGQRLDADFDLRPVAVELPPLAVTATRDLYPDAANAGPAQVITESAMARLPVPARDFSLFALLSPQVILTAQGGLSIAGQSDRLNALQIDGATNNDLLGSSFLGGVGTPGRNRGARTLSVEALKELQVVIAPFDVRFGNFAAGLVNAVTRSGTNAFHGTLVTHFSGGALVGKDPDGSRGTEFDTREIGVTLGGPVVRDRLAFFLDAGLQRQTLPQDVPLIGRDTAGGADSAVVGIRRASLLRFQEILQRTYGVDAGTDGPYPLRVPAGNLFAKLTLQLGVNSRLELSHDFSHSAPDVLTFAPEFSCRYAGGFCLGSSGFIIPVTTHATRLEWNAAPGGRFSNQLLVARLRSRNSCRPATTAFPSLSVHADQGELIAGAADFCFGESQVERLLELTDNLTVSAGRHRATLGTHDELIALPRTSPLDFQLYNSWRFGSLDSLERRLPYGYSSTFLNLARSTGPLSDLHLAQIGFYLQDEWSPAPALTLTAGLRLDLPILSRHPVANPGLLTELGLDNTRTPGGHAVWSPRVGFSLRAGANGSTVVRGGAGLFVGRPAYKWFDAVFAHTGLETTHLECNGADVPPFVLPLSAQPTQCGSPGIPATPYVDLFDPGFRFPRNLKIAAGVDRRLAGDIVATVDLLYTRGLEQFFLTDVNLSRSLPAAVGEGGRAMYGTVGGGGVATPRRQSAAFGRVLRVSNARGDRAVSLSGQLQKRFAGGTEIAAAYAYTSSRDRFSSSADAADADLGQVPLDGTLDRRRLGPPAWSVPHKVTVVGTMNLPGGFRLGLFYTGVSGRGYTYVVEGDANADGFGSPLDFSGGLNDVVYVPRNPVPSGDVDLVLPDSAGGFAPAPAAEYARLAQLIAGEGCLREARGRLASRNSCRNPWSNRTSARLSKLIPVGRSRSLELMLDAFNVLHLLHDDWGLVREAGGGDKVPLLRLVGYDAANARGVYQLLPIQRNAVASAESRWRVQLGTRFVF